MNYTCIDVDIWCKYSGTPPSYRVYVDNDLLTERTFIWNSANNYVREHIEVTLDKGKHSLRVEKYGDPHASFILNNITVNGKPSDAIFMV